MSSSENRDGQIPTRQRKRLIQALQESIIQLQRGMAEADR